MSNTKKNKKKAPKKQHISPPAVKSSPSPVAKLKKTVKPAPRRRGIFSKRALYALAAIFLMLNGGIFVALSRDQTPASSPTVTEQVNGTTIATPAYQVNQTSASPAALAKQTYTAPPTMTIDVNKKYAATIETTKGSIKLELFAKDAPNTVNNFVFLANQGFYDGTTFHRVIRTPTPFMAQGGDPTGTGAGGPGYQIPDEINSQKFLTGTLGMANSGPNTNGSQFFITYGPEPQLDGKYTVFGQVTEGMDVLQKITERDPQNNPPYTGDVMTSVTIQVSN